MMSDPHPSAASVRERLCELAARARHVSDLMSSKGKWRMSIPPQTDDSDMTIHALADAIDDAVAALAAAEQRAEQAEKRAFTADRLRLEDGFSHINEQVAFTATRDAQAAEIVRLREALKNLRIDANRLCDRQLGGTYEDDCRSAIKAADAALAPVPGGTPTP